MSRGGARPGAGRKPVHDEIMAREICQSAIEKKFGTLEAGIEYLLGTGEPSLLKFVFEHAIGKPKEKMELSGDAEAPLIWHEVKTYATQHQTDTSA